MLIYVLFVIGFYALIKGADYLITGSSSLAKRLGIPALVIGLTVVAFGTSAPELVVSSMAALNGNTDIAIGNIVGSNIANILLILGVASVIYPLQVSRGTVWKEIPFSLLAIVIVGLMANDLMIDGRLFSEISRIDGLVLLSFFIIFIYYSFSIIKVEGKIKKEETTSADRSLSLAIAMTVGGLIGLTIGGRWVVSGASEIARVFGIGESLIGLTIVAIGTSLPELVTSAVAAFRKNPDIAIGNAVGSNIFNVFFVLGTSATIRPLSFSTEMNTDVMIAAVASVMLFLAMFFKKKHVLERSQGVAFLVLYVAYISYLVFKEVIV